MFEVSVEFVEVASNTYPVIIVPGGITAPVMCKSDLLDASGQRLLKQKTIYVRTVRHGNVSTTEAGGEDLKDLIETCVANREVDYSRFLTKLFRGLQPHEFRAALVGAQQLVNETSRVVGNTDLIRNDSLKRFAFATEKTGLDPQEFGFRDIALLIDSPQRPQWSTNQQFIETLHLANPNLSRWPTWLIATFSMGQEHRPQVKGDVFEQHILVKPTPQQQDLFGPHWDFSIFDPSGRFFLRRILPDDFRCGEFYGKMKISLDPVIQIFEITESLRTGQRFAQALGYEASKTSLHFEFWWTLLQGRIFGSWNYPAVTFDFVPSKATDDNRRSKVLMPMDASRDELITCVGEAFKPLSQAFGGYEVPYVSLAHLAKIRLEREQTR